MKAKISSISGLIFIIVSLSSCVKSIVPNVERYNELLVVDGGVNDGPGPYVIKLSRSTKTQERSQVIPYTGCKVEVRDNLGNKFLLSETRPGNYQSDSLSFQAIAGRTYQLHVETPEEETVESIPEPLPKGLKIQSVYGELEHKADKNFFYGKDGYQFYVDAEPLPTTNNYLFWRMQSTFKFRLDYDIVCYYDNGIHPVLQRDSLKNCYQTKDVLDIFLLNTNEFQQKEIKRFPLNYEDNYTKALSIRYSLNVTQFTINETAFTYWSAVKKMIDAGGELFTQQPYQVENNLKCINDPDKAVLGYFMVAGISEKRIFLNPAPLIIRESICKIVTPQKYPLQWFVNRPDLWPVFYADVAGGLYVEQECLDCRKTGTLKPPPFWKE